MKQYLIPLILTLFCGCFSDSTHPIKYNFNDKNYDCIGIYDTKDLIKIICFFNNGDTTLVHNYKNGKLNGKSSIYYPNGKIKETGEYLNGWKYNCWRDYYPNGKIKSYQYYNPDSDSLDLTYQKNTKKMGSWIQYYIIWFFQLYLMILLIMI